jgi:hypothetical protein
MENMDILSQLQTKERDSMEVIKYLRKENEELQEKLRKYKEEADEAREVAERTMRTAGEERDRAISEIETKFRTNDEVREAEVRKLREDLFSLKTFKDRKEVLEAELESVHQELFDAQTAHKEAMSGVERKLIEEKTRLQKEAHAQLMEIKRNTDEEVVNRLDVSTKRILQQNRRLAEDLKLHVQETADLQRIKATLEAENLKMKRDMSLNKEQVIPSPSPPTLNLGTWSENSIPSTDCAGFLNLKRLCKEHYKPFCPGQPGGAVLQGEVGEFERGP